MIGRMTEWAHRVDTRRTVAQVVSLAGGRGIAALLSAAWLMAAARLLSAPAFGDLTLMLAVGAVAGVAADLGLQLTHARHVAERQAIDRWLLVDTIRRRVTLCVLVGFPVSLIYLLAASNRTALVPVVFAGSLVGTAVYSTETMALNTVGHAYVDAGNEALSRAGVLAAGTFWLLHGGGLLAAVAVYALADICSAAAVTTMTWQQTVGSAGPNPPREPLWRTAPLAAALATAALYGQLDVWLLALFRGTAISGAYAGADRILEALLLLPSALASIAIGRAGRHRHRRRWEVTRAFALVAAVSIAGPAIAVAVFAHPILLALWGHRFGVATDTLVLLVASAIPGATICVLAPLAAITQQSGFLRAMAIGLTVNVFANVITIPRFGMVGAAYANLLSELSLAVCLWFSLRRVLVRLAADGPVDNIPCALGAPIER